MTCLFSVSAALSTPVEAGFLLRDRSGETPASPVPEDIQDSYRSLVLWGYPSHSRRKRRIGCTPELASLTGLSQHGELVCPVLLCPLLKKICLESRICFAPLTHITSVRCSINTGFSYRPTILQCLNHKLFLFWGDQLLELLLRTYCTF